VGKSNIIEALSLFSTPYLTENSSRKLSNLVRLENETELFYNGNTGQDAIIQTNRGDCTVRYNPKSGLEIFLNGSDANGLHAYFIDENLTVQKKDGFFESSIKRYNYKSNIHYRKSHARYLIPPFGFNLLTIIEKYKEFKEQIVGLFAEYGLTIAFDKSSQTIKVIQSRGPGNIFLIPYNSIADTLQRIIFYKAAIASNNDSILLFEEPEAHSFPPYMTHLTQEMIHKTDNQYIIATHSPFILNDLLENILPELSVFVVHYENLETKVRQLSENELHDVLQNGVDLFTNNESFV
jgi:AAA15 family ATPase/GTPase